MKRPRSVLFVPGDKSLAIEKARTLGADMLILDLEDAVAPEHKAQARENVCAALRQGFPMPALVRLNGPGTPWEADDQAAVMHCHPDGLVLPKVEQTGAVRCLRLGVPLWLMIETPRGVLAAPELAAEQGVAGLIAGANDLSRELRARHTPERTPLLYALSAMVLAARAYGKLALDAVHNDITDAAGFEYICIQGRDLGFDGKSLIHPSQIDTANRCYGVSDEEAQTARALLSSWEAGRSEGKSVTTFRGKLLEELHVSEARELLAEVGTRQ